MKNILVIFLFWGLTCNSQEIKPPFIATFGNVINGYLLKEDLKNLDSIVVYCSDSSLMDFEIIGFDVEWFSGGLDASKHSDSKKLSIDQKKLIAKRSINDIFYITNIRILTNSNIDTSNIIKIFVDGPKACIFRNTDSINYKFKITDSVEIVRNVYYSPIVRRDKIKLINFLNNKHILIAKPSKSYNNNETEIDCNSRVYSYRCSIEWDANGVGFFDEKEFQVYGDEITNEIKEFLSVTPNIKKIQIFDINGISTSKSIFNVGYLILDIE